MMKQAAEALPRFIMAAGTEVEVDSIKAQLVSDDMIAIGFVDSTGPRLHIGDPTTGLTEYQISTDFPVTEVQPWLTPNGELIVVAIGESEFAHGYAKFLP